MGLFHGIRIPGDGPILSHLHFADDALVLGDWSLSNVQNLMRLLRSFYLVSGLKVNLGKCCFYGLNVEAEEIDNKTHILKCKSGSSPFNYIGLVVGANMNRIKFWQPVIDKFESRLSSWKAKRLSMGGHLVLVKSVLDSLPMYFFSLYKAPCKVIQTLEKIRLNFLWGGVGNNRKVHWVSRDVVSKPKEDGGLGLIPLKIFNLFLIAKWYWRFLQEPNWLWRLVVNGVHKFDRRPGIITCKQVLSVTWNNDFKVDVELQQYGVNMEDHLSVVGSSWRWSGDPSGESSAKSLCVMVIKYGIPSPGFVYKWCSLIPTNASLFMWRAQLGRLATFDGLASQNISVANVVCPLCEGGCESASHLLTGCWFAAMAWNMVSGWCQTPQIFAFSVDDLLKIHLGLKWSKKKAEIMYAIVISVCWVLWKARNEAVFNWKKPSL